MKEDALHRSVADLLARILRKPTLWTTFPSGGGGRVRGAQLKAKGLQPGWPDILIIHPAKYWTVVLGLELKVKAAQSAEQKGIAAGFWLCNAQYAVCRSFEDVFVALNMASIPSYGR